MRRLISILALSALLAGCGVVPWAKTVSLQSPEAARVAAALARWPSPPAGDVLRRPFFATFHVAGVRTTASGILEYRGPRDFRVTAVTEMGVILFDGRVNWGGVTIFRQMPGLDTAAVESLLSDMVRAFDLPRELSGLKANDKKMVITRRLADTHEYNWVFDRQDGRLLETQVDPGGINTLHVTYSGYSTMGWPKDLQVSRRARLYDASFSFTDDAVVVDGGGGK